MISTLAEPTHEAPVWRIAHGGVEARFVGRVAATDRREVLALAAAAGSAHPPGTLAWLRQVHSADVVRAAGGDCGPGDALWTERAGQALAIATADCVPLLLAGGDRVAAAHAGWRGIVAGVVSNAVLALGGDPAGIAAWIGPAIGACCYEVGEEVAAALTDAADESVLVRGRARPHVDLQAAVRRQLERAGVSVVATVARCTRCSPDLLWSYRRDGSAAGRNLAFIWRREPT